MALPKIDLPLFEVDLPSTGEKIKMRPYTVKEEKILLVGQESDDSDSELLATRQVVNNCLQDIDAGDLPLFDLEYLLLQLRSRSVDNKVSFSIKDPETEEPLQFDLDIEDVKIEYDENHSKEIKINDKYTLFLRYPSINDMIKLADLPADDPLTSYNIMVNCLDYIASDDEVENFKDYKDTEIEEFMEGLPNSVLNKITTFFETMPKLRHEIKYQNNKGEDKVFVIEGNRSFFI